MRKLLLSLITLLPMGAFAQSDTIHVKGGFKFATTIQKVEEGRVFFTSDGLPSSIPVKNIERYHWAGEASRAKKGDNVIYIQTSDTPLVAYKKMADALMSAGFVIETSDKDLLIVKSEVKPVYKGRTLMRINYNVSSGDSAVITLTSQHTVPPLVSSPSPVSFGPENSFTGAAWHELDKVAKAYGGTVTYGKR